jgi:NADH:ubiquinone oxidoreductase subunit E
MKYFKDGNMVVASQPLFGQLRTTTTVSHDQKVDTLIEEDQTARSHIQACYSTPCCAVGGSDSGIS